MSSKRPMRSALLLILLFMYLDTASCWRSYEIHEYDTGWSTGRRFTMNISMDLYGYALGTGDHSRYTEIDINHVSMSERVSAKNGTMESEEMIALKAAGDNVNTTSTLVKMPGTQNYMLSVDEVWPVVLNTSSTIDYRGAGISSRETFINNLDRVGTSYLYTKDLRKERTCDMYLKSAWFQLSMNDSTDTIISDLFRPTKKIHYSIGSHSSGLVMQRYRQYSDKAPASEGFDTYWGSFDIRSVIDMESRGKNLGLEESWVGKNTYDAAVINEAPERGVYMCGCLGYDLVSVPSPGPEWLSCCMLSDTGTIRALRDSIWSCSGDVR
ncbi:MAG: hypothetical protein NQU42_02340 [Methanothrix sp.]|uniref:hypothetical protein n=1 Tax=Methanothrix sp. TaxID=90426 RepID=UPI0025CE340B|nr:hypothetical protein [Methanothrix sp.]MCQ8902924.1 hypothetical protein [Methanothrix sp.]